MRLLIKSLLFTLIFISFACQDDNPVVNNNQNKDYYKFEATSILYENGEWNYDSQWLSEEAYFTDGKLTSVITYIPDYGTVHHNFTYNQNGDTILYEYDIDGYENEYHIYEYNEDNTLVKKTHYDWDSTEIGHTEYLYENNLLIRRNYIRKGDSVIEYYYLYFYNDKDLLIKKEEYDISFEEVQEIASYKYDSNKNMIEERYDFGSGSSLIVNKFNSSNLLIEKIVNIDGVLLGKIVYEYFY